MLSITKTKQQSDEIADEICKKKLVSFGEDLAEINAKFKEVLTFKSEQ